MPDLTQPVKDLLERPPLRFLHIFPTAPNLDHDQDLPDLVAPFGLFEYGIAFSAVVIPPYLSRAVGEPPVYRLPLIRLYLYEQTAGGTEQLVDDFEAHIPNSLFRYIGLNTTRKHVVVLPGVEMAWGYLA